MRLSNDDENANTLKCKLIIKLKGDVQKLNFCVIFMEWYIVCKNAVSTVPCKNEEVGDFS